MFLEPTPTLKIKKTEYVDKVHLSLELSHEQNQKLEKLKALKSHKHNVESLLMDLIEKELKSYESKEFSAPRSKNPRQISKRLRNDVLRTANYQCQFPGCDSDHFLQVDHIVPVRWGGDQRRNNLQILCSSHNLHKG